MPPSILLRSSFIVVRFILELVLCMFFLLDLCLLYEHCNLCSYLSSSFDFLRVSYLDRPLSRICRPLILNRFLSMFCRSLYINHLPSGLIHSSYLSFYSLYLLFLFCRMSPRYNCLLSPLYNRGCLRLYSSLRIIVRSVYIVHNPLSRFCVLYLLFYVLELSSVYRLNVCRSLYHFLPNLVYCRLLGRLRYRNDWFRFRYIVPNVLCLLRSLHLLMYFVRVLKYFKLSLCFCVDRLVLLVSFNLYVRFLLLYYRLFLSDLFYRFLYLLRWLELYVPLVYKSDFSICLSYVFMSLRFFYKLLNFRRPLKLLVCLFYLINPFFYHFSLPINILLVPLWLSFLFFTFLRLFFIVYSFLLYLESLHSCLLFFSHLFFDFLRCFFRLFFTTLKTFILSFKFFHPSTLTTF